MDFFSALKDVTYGVAVEDRAIVADEFRFTLSKVHRPYYLFLLVVLPFFYVLSLIRNKKTSLFYTILPSLFLLWIGIGVTRAAPYAGIGLFVFAIVEMSGGEGFKFKGSWICSLKENFIPRNKELSRLVAPGISVFIFVSLVLFLSSEQYQLGKTVFTEKTTGKIKEVLRRYPDVPAFTSGMVGGYVLWHWWPYKKVFLQPKTTAVPDRFMRRMTKAHSTPKRTYGTIMEHGIKLALLTEPMYNRGRNFFGIHPDWIQGVSPDYPEDVAIYCHKALCGDPEDPPPKKGQPLAR